jgi:hypothetical protein
MTSCAGNCTPVACGLNVPYVTPRIQSFSSPRNRNLPWIRGRSIPPGPRASLPRGFAIGNLEVVNESIETCYCSAKMKPWKQSCNERHPSRTRFRECAIKSGRVAAAGALRDRDSPFP